MVGHIYNCMYIDDHMYVAKFMYVQYCITYLTDIVVKALQTSQAQSHILIYLPQLLQAGATLEATSSVLGSSLTHEGRASYE